ncbi:MAG: hypothetical protein GY714_28145 [Desulfobacterales bacterium]|nr:hypothetical protein [Desulfobacterales bacterium]
MYQIDMNGYENEGYPRKVGHLFTAIIKKVCNFVRHKFTNNYANQEKDYKYI